MKEIKLAGSVPQKKIINAWENQSEDILIDAIAGSGKTTLLMYLISICKYRVLYLAFNKSIQIETTVKLKENGLKQGLAKTIHSLGLLALKKSGNKIVTKNSVKWDLIKILKTKNKKFLKKYTWKEQQAISYTLIDLHDVSRLYLTEDFKELKKILLDMDKFCNKSKDMELIWKKFIEVRDEHYSKKILVIDFTDMIYLPVRLNLRIPISPYYLFVDECQDLSKVQHKIVEMLISQGEVQRTVFCGDKRQTIYGFSGAYSKSISDIEERVNTKSFPLNICYRCPKAVIGAANEVYDVMLGNKEEVGLVDVVNDIRDIKENSLVICRNTDPLIDLYLELISLDVPCVLKGEDILNGITNFLKPYSNSTVYMASKEIGYQIEDLEDDTSEEGGKKLHILKNNLKIFNKIIKIFSDEVGEISHLIVRLKSLFVVKENAVTLCTIHKSKGLEADIVYILNESKTIPSKFAKSKQQLEQEQNLKYVARTRAKKEMYYLDVKL